MYSHAIELKNINKVGEERMKKGNAAVVVLMVAACCLLSPATADVDIVAGFTNQPFTGTSCFGDKDKGDKVVQVSGSLWDEIDAKCGKRLRVICEGPVTPGKADDVCNTSSSSYVDVIVVDRCEDCEDGTIKLSKEAFKVIAYEKAHRIKVQYVWAPDRHHQPSTLGKN